MAAEELSQDEIDSLFEKEEDNNDKKSEEDDKINPSIKDFFNLVNTSVEDVLKTAFSLEVVSKFIDLNLKNKDELPNEDGVYLTVDITVFDTSAELFIYTKKDFASILSDLMLMGPGEVKEKLEPDDLDAIKELFSQVFGNFQTAFKEKNSKEISVNIKAVQEQAEDRKGELFYNAEFDVAIPNIKSDSIIFFVEKALLDRILELEKVKEAEEEKTEDEIPFKGVENISESEDAQTTYKTKKIESDNLDLIMDVDLDVKIRIGEKNMLIKDILTLKEGSIVELEKNIEEPMDILINDKVVAKGVVVVVGGRFGVKITSIETKEERIKSLGG